MTGSSLHDFSNCVKHNLTRQLDRGLHEVDALTM